MKFCIVSSQSLFRSSFSNKNKHRNNCKDREYQRRFIYGNYPEKAYNMIYTASKMMLVLHLDESPGINHNEQLLPPVWLVVLRASEFYALEY